MKIAFRLRAALYDAAIVPMTATWYASVLERVPHRCRLLDVGIGTGAALLENTATLLAKDIRVTGIDIDAAYVERCREAVAGRGLSDRVDATLQSVYDHRGGPYDAVYFSGSFMLLPDPVAALRLVSSTLGAQGRIYFTQTFEHDRARLVEWIKPMLRFVTSIDFGGVTYEADFRRALSDAEVVIEDQVVLHPGSARSSVLVVARAF